MGVEDAADDILNADARALAPRAVVSQVALMSVISVVTVLAFNILRPKNKIIYEPKVKYHVGDKPPPKISDSMFGWLPPLIRCKDAELIEKIGLDAVTFLRFCRLLRWLFTGITLLTCGILLPINVVYNLRNVDEDKRDILSMLTIRDVGGTVLYAHVVVTYLITFMICGLVWLHWRTMVGHRRNWFRSPEHMQSFYARTLAVLHVPKKLQSDEGIRAIFESVQVPYPTTSVHIGRKVGKLPDYVEQYNDTVRELERYLVKYLKGGKLGKKRPTVTIGGTLGMGGQKHDAINFYTAKLKRMEDVIERHREEIQLRKAESYGFASMAAVPYAHIVAKLLQGKHPKGTDITLAPNPKDIIWSNMNMSDGEITRKKIHGFLWLAVICFLNTVPLLIISALANLSTLSTYVPFLERWHNASEASFDFVSGVLPPAVSALFGFFLPIIMRKLTRYMGALTHSRTDRAVIARYFAFLVISQLVIFTLIGVIFNSVKQIILSIGKKSFSDVIHGLDNLPDRINSTYIDQSSYWLTFFPLRGFLVLFDLAQIINLVWLSIKTHVFGRTPRDIREWTQPPEFEYAIYYSNMLFMAAVGMVFAPLAPLVPLAAMLVFWMSSFVYKYQLMFVYISKVETGGRLWNVVINRLLSNVVLMQALMVLTIGLQYGFKSLQWISTIPPIFIMIAFKIYTTRTFNAQFNYYTPTEEELRMAKVHSERGDIKGNRIEKRFGHPALHAELFTPMLHAKMMPLLSQVYSGKIGKGQTKLDEYGGQKMDAQLVEGIKIAAIHHNDLEYDPALYQRDRGELDWDARSIASTTLTDATSMMPAGSKAGFYANGSQANLLHGYDRYLHHGPGASQSDIELNALDSPQEPLLSPRAQYFQQPAQSYGPQQSQNGQMRPAPRRQDSSFTYRESPDPNYGNGTHGMPPPPGISYGPERSGSPYSMRSESPSHLRTSPTGGNQQPTFDPYATYNAPSPSQMQQGYQQSPRGSPRATPQPQHQQPQRSYSRDPYGAYPPVQQQQPPQQGGNLAGRGAHRN